MSFFNSRVSVFNLTDSGGVSRALTAFITSIEGIPGEREMNDVTALGDTGRKHIAGLDNVTIELAGVFDDTATTGPDAVLRGLRADDTARAWDYGPKGSTATYVKYSGTMKLKSYGISTKVGDQIMWRATLLVQGAVTIGTY